MEADALVLREVNDHVWLDFASNARNFANRGAAHPLIERWQRARALGASLDGPPSEEHLLRGEELKAHVERTEEVAHLADTDLAQAASDVSVRAFVLLLADPTGVVVRASGGGDFANDARRLRLIEGADWSEVARGTNAIGTAVAEQRPTFVRGNAHFARRFHDIVCYAAPIFDADGALVAVLDATSSFARADDSVGEAVIRTAGAITRALRDRAFGPSGAAVLRTLARAVERMTGVALLIEPSLRVARMNAGAKTLLGDGTGRHLDALLGFDTTALVAEARNPRGLQVRVGELAFKVRVDPVDGGGKLIAFLVYLEPEASRAKAVPRGSAAPSVAPAFAPFSSVFARDASSCQALAWAHRIADSDVPILLLAETGAGKELVARSIHAASRRAAEPFVAVNCGAIAPSLLESELFGYGPSAFTGADRAGRQGLFASASGGTIFLDEVAEMPLSMQAALLRVLEDGSYRRVGEATARQVNVRVVSATCRDIAAMVSAGTFRQDLYYRLKGAEVSLPPLRERTDIADLAMHQLSQLAGARLAPGLSPEVIAFFERYPWPGNVRELRSVLEVSLLLARDCPMIEPEHLPPDFIRRCRTTDPDGAPPSSDLDTAERSTVRRALAEVGGNITSAAKRLGIARSTLYRMMRKHGLVT